MTIVVGLAPDERGLAALLLGNELALSAEEPLHVCVVVAAPWPPSPDRLDAEYLSILDRAAQAALDDAAKRLNPNLAASFELKHARSVPAGLLEVARERDTATVVLGSSPAGMLGRVMLGSVGNRMLHSAGVPVAIAPRGYLCDPLTHVSRISVAYGGSSEDDLVVAAGALAARVRAAFRIVSFVVHPKAYFGGLVTSDAEELVMNRWAKDNAKAVDAALARLRGLPNAPDPLEVTVGQGDTWAQAIDSVAWEPSDVLVVGSSSAGPIERVFIGSRASKIVRDAPVPVVCVPRSAAKQRAADELDR